MVECICINSENKPNEIPLSKWIQKGFKYHITHVFYHPNQGIQGCSLHEVKLRKESDPYESYKLNRFALTKDNLLKLIEMMKICSELNELDIPKIRKSITNQ